MHYWPPPRVKSGGGHGPLAPPPPVADPMIQTKELFQISSNKSSIHNRKLQHYGMTLKNKQAIQYMTPLLVSILVNTLITHTSTSIQVSLIVISKYNDIEKFEELHKNFTINLYVIPTRTSFLLVLCFTQVIR